MNPTRALTAFLLCLLVIPARAADSYPEPVRFARTPDISPDGKTVAFSYLGDIWTVPAKGGTARLITMHEAHDYLPIFSPDGKSIAFASKRHGQYDVFVTNVEGGKPTRLTFHSAEDLPCGWSPDGKFILFTSNRTVEYPPRYELYTVPAKGGRVQRVTRFDGKDGCYSPDGTEIAYTRGPGTWYRKGYRGSSNDEIWICNADGTNNRRLTRFDGQDSYPCWSPDRKSIYYVSETFGAEANIVRQDLSNKPGEPLAVSGPPKQITFHKGESVRRARLSGNGEWLVYECGGDLWIAPTGAGQPRRLHIVANADHKTNPERTVTYTSGATEFAVAPDERHSAFVVHGEIFLVPRGGGKATRLTDHPAHDHAPAWSADSRSLIFLSDRNGHEDVYLLESDDPDHPQLVKAHQFKVKQLTKTPAAESGLRFSPDGKRISYIREGRLYTMNPDGTDEKCVVNEQTVIDYEWSPDAKWLCYARLDGSYASELYIIPSGGATPADPPRNVTRYATYNAGVTWSRRGNKLAFLSDRGIGAERSVFVMDLQKPAAPDAAPSPDIDWQDIERRVRRVATVGASRAAISLDGKMVAFRNTTGGDDLWVANTDGTSVRRITTGNMKPTQIQWSNLLPTLLYFRDGNGNLRMVTLNGKGETLLVPFTAKMTINREEEQLEIFDQSWRALHENFYDPSYHGVDWKAVRQKYRPLVRHVALDEDLHALISLMLGELNASHLGIRGEETRPESATAELGVLFDERYTGPGLKVAEILRRGPADQHGIKLRPGDVITRIDRTPITDATDVAKLLNGKAGEMVTLEVTSDPANPKDRRRVELWATTREAVGLLLYERWVEQNARKVAQLSGGKLGYIHIPSMNEAGLERFLRALYSECFDKDGIVLDVRFNGGGYTHDKILNYLGGTEHTVFVQRHGGKGTVFRAADRKWSKPVVLLINDRSFSDAEIFPSAFRTLGLGKLVGVPTGGRVIGTRTMTLIDGSTFKVPSTGVYTIAGINMEKKGVTPDVIIDTHPDQLARGTDAQIEKAVQVLQEDVVRWKQRSKGVTLNRFPPAVSPSPSVGGTPPGAAKRE